MSNKMKTTNTIDTLSAATAGIAARKQVQTVTGGTDGMARASAGVEQARTKMKDGIEKAMKTAEGMATFGQGNIDALTKSALIWTAGVQDLSKQLAASFHASVQETMGVIKTLGMAKTVKEAIELQTSIARSTFEKAISESGRLTKASLKLTEQALAPLSSQLSSAAPTFGKTA